MYFCQNKHFSSHNPPYPPNQIFESMVYSGGVHSVKESMYSFFLNFGNLLIFYPYNFKLSWTPQKKYAIFFSEPNSVVNIITFCALLTIFNFHPMTVVKYAQSMIFHESSWSTLNGKFLVSTVISVYR